MILWAESEDTRQKWCDAFEFIKIEKLNIQYDAR